MQGINKRQYTTRTVEWISQEKVVAMTGDAQKGTIDNPIEIPNPFDNLATQEHEEADLIQEPTSHNPHISMWRMRQNLLKEDWTIATWKIQAS